MRKIILVFSLVGTLISSVAHLQSVIPAILNASGSTIFFMFYRFEWSFGEAIAINTAAEASNLIVANGMIQSNTHDRDGIDNNSGWINDEIRILPTPASNLLEVNFFGKQKGKVPMSLFTKTGQLLINHQFDYYETGRIEHWKFVSFPSDQYFMKIKLVAFTSSVSKDDSFKIIKIK